MNAGSFCKTKSYFIYRLEYVRPIVKVQQVPIEALTRASQTATAEQFLTHSLPFKGAIPIENKCYYAGEFAIFFCSSTDLSIGPASPILFSQYCLQEVLMQKQE